VSFVDQNLLAGEQVTYRTHLHWKVYIGPVLLSVLVFAPLTWLAFVSQRRMVTIAPAVGIVVAILSAYLRRRSSEFAVTNKRVIMKLGVFQTRSVELLLPKVEGIAVDQGMGGKLFGYGNITVTGSGGTREQFAGIGHPMAFRQAVQGATDRGSTP